MEVADVAPPHLDPVELRAVPAPAVDDPEATRALEELAMAWKQESNGTAEAIAVLPETRLWRVLPRGRRPAAGAGGVRQVRVAAGGPR